MYLFCQVAEGAKAAGAARIIGVDIDPFKIEQGMKYPRARFACARVGVNAECWRLGPFCHIL